MSTKKIFVVNMILLALTVVVFTVISLVPNDADRLRRLQESYVPSAESGEENHWAYFLINEENPLPDGYTFPKKEKEIYECYFHGGLLR